MARGDMLVRPQAAAPKVDATYDGTLLAKDVANEPGYAEVPLLQALPSEVPLPVGPVMAAATPRACRFPMEQPPPHPQLLSWPGHSGEVFLMETLGAMDHHMRIVRKTQQGLVATVELACREALGNNFFRLVLVGSAAIRVETPGSDVDIVCFTRRDGPEAGCLPVVVLRKVHETLRKIVSRYSGYSSGFSMELIDDARVPILRVLWGTPGLEESCVAVDVSVDQLRPVDHVRWFQRVGAAPRTASRQMLAPLVSLILRCVKWWLKQRQIPRTKDGGLPTLAWLLLALHVCSQPETHEQAIIGQPRPMAALLAALEAFFKYYNSLEKMDGVLQFAPDGSSSEFKRTPPSEKKRPAPWAELAVLDPTRAGAESLNLAPWLPVSTQLLLVYELRRAWSLFSKLPRFSEAETVPGECRTLLGEVFAPLPAGANELPSVVTSPIAALVLCGEIEGGSNIPEVELAIIESVLAKPGWAAPFLMRHDERSEVHVRLCDVEESGGRYVMRKKSFMVLCPVHFICRAHMEKDSNQRWCLEKKDYERLVEMKRYMRSLSSSSSSASTPSTASTDGSVPDVNPP